MTRLRTASFACLLAAAAAGCAGGAPPPGMPTPNNANLPPEPPVVVEAEMPDSAADASADTVADLASGLPEGVDPADFTLPLQYNDRVRYWLEYYQRYHDRFGTWLTRMARYEPLIRERLDAYDLPTDLIYLALIESGFSPTAYSRAKAVGIWQFMAGTARGFGLEVGTYVDERRDPIRSTDAAVRYLRALHKQFGSWYLAAAAYNSGDGRVERALQQVAGGARGDDSLFWQIDSVLPAETRNYVPQLLAASILAKYPQRFGFDDLVLPAPDSFETVRVRSATDLAVVARAADASEDDVVRLNPQFYRGVTPPRRTVEVRVPAGHADGFAAALAKIPESERARDLEHVVAKGETLAEIADRFDVSVSALKKANHIKRRAPVGRRLTIPLGPPTRLALKEAPRREDDEKTVARADEPETRATSSKARSSEADTKARTYKVRSGDTLSEIAEDHGVSLAELRELNHLGRKSTIRPGQELVLSKKPKRRSGRVVVYKVHSGDTLWKIAQDHGCTPEQIREWNDLGERSVLQPGDRLELRVQSD